MTSQITGNSAACSTAFRLTTHKTSKLRINRSLWWGIHRWPLASLTKDRWCGKRFHVMTSSWYYVLISDVPGLSPWACPIITIRYISGFSTSNLTNHITSQPDTIEPESLPNVTSWYVNRMTNTFQTDAFSRRKSILFQLLLIFLDVPLTTSQYFFKWSRSIARQQDFTLTNADQDPRCHVASTG